MPGLLKGSSYDPRRGGHAPGDVREAFRDALDAFEDWKDGTPEPTVELREQQVPISQLCGLLWNCRDTMPDLWFRIVGDMCGSDEEGPSSRTYGAAARWMKAQIADQLRRDHPVKVVQLTVVE